MESLANIVIGGDIFPTLINYDLFSNGNASDLFSKEIKAIFDKADYSICNLEGCFTENNATPKPKGGPNIRAPKECVRSIANLGVNCVSLANNHATDYGLEGLQCTRDVLDEHGITHFGEGNDEASISTHYTVSVNGLIFTIYGVSETMENVATENSPGVNVFDEYRVCNELRNLRKNCDYLIVLYHGGIENTHYNTPSIQQRFHRMADSGADIVISQHTHAIGEEEHYNDSYLLYGQGNFCFHFSKKLDEWTETALLLDIDFSREGYKIRKHVVRRVGPRVEYDIDQDLHAFYDRSMRLATGDRFEDELSQLADEKTLSYLHIFRGWNIFDKIARRILSKERYRSYLRSKYSSRDIMMILLVLQSEEFREVASRGLLNMLEEIQQTEKTNG